MKFNCALLAEARAHDARGALTAVGLNQNVIIAEQLPAPAQGVVIAQITPNTDPPCEIHIQIELKDSQGQVLFAQSASGHVEPSLHEEVPTALSLTIDYNSIFSLYGKHTFTLNASTREGETASQEVPLWVVRPPAPPPS